MPAPTNTFKQALRDGRLQLGCWLGLTDSYSAEIATTAAYDWLLIDGEHAPNDLRTILGQLQIVQASGAHAAVRLPVGETWMIKQVLDAGAQTLLIPMVESAEQARELVRAVTYPPTGERGVGSALARASNFSAIPDYLQTADDQVCLLVQVENRAGLAALDDILKVDGVDGVFVGPADLAADLGHLGNADHPVVDAAIMDALDRIVKAGKAAGIITPDIKLQKRCVDIGVTFLATAIDVLLLAQAARANADDARKRLLQD